MKGRMQTRPVLTVVMYHYVRHLAASRHPRIKGLETEAFEAQLDYIEKHYTPISGDELCLALAGGKELPDMPILLSFDDGYIEHFDTVFPALMRRGFKGAFYPPVNAVRDRVVLDVNKIHFILATVEDLSPVIRHIDATVIKKDFGSIAEFKSKYMTASRYDTPETMYVKRMLQFGLPEDVRRQLTSQLFLEFVSTDERSFADGLYLTEESLKQMLSQGMTIGGHGFTHSWLNHLPPENQQRELSHSIDWLKQLGVSKDRLTYCYPFGGYNTDTLRLLRNMGCKFALTTRVDLNAINGVLALEIARIDTNDLPQYRNAKRVEWTDRAQKSPT
jgi:peptidoglycan/xylan/chitin deacetylase (PgdA/CDA1 family)